MSPDLFINPQKRALSSLCFGTLVREDYSKTTGRPWWSTGFPVWATCPFHQELAADSCWRVSVPRLLYKAWSPGIETDLLDVVYGAYYDLYHADNLLNKYLSSIHCLSNSVVGLGKYCGSCPHGTCFRTGKVDNKLINTYKFQIVLGALTKMKQQWGKLTGLSVLSNWLLSNEERGF